MNRKLGEEVSYAREGGRFRKRRDEVPAGLRANIAMSGVTEWIRTSTPRKEMDRG